MNTVKIRLRMAEVRKMEYSYSKNSTCHACRDMSCWVCRAVLFQHGGRRRSSSARV